MASIDSPATRDDVMEISRTPDLARISQEGQSLFTMVPPRYAREARSSYNPDLDTDPSLLA